MTNPPGGNGSTGSSAAVWVLRMLGLGAALIVLITFGLRVGTSEARLASLEQQLTNEVLRAATVHTQLEQRCTERNQDGRALTQAELRALERRIERLERRYP